MQDSLSSRRETRINTIPCTTRAPEDHPVSTTPLPSSANYV